LAFYALVAVTLLPDAIYYLFEIDTNPAVWSLLQIGICFFGIVGRLVLQPEKNRWRRRGIIAILIALIGFVAAPALAEETRDAEFDDIAFELISRWEGKRNFSYQDIVGVWTICYGHTRTAAPGQYKSDNNCKALLIEEIDEYRKGLHKHFTPTTLAVRLPPTRDAAYTSLAFNVGIRGAGRSTATRRLNAGKIGPGCTALTWWNKAGGRVVRGLARRRADEQRYCLMT